MILMTIQNSGFPRSNRLSARWVLNLYSCQSGPIALHSSQRGALSFQFDEVTEASAVGSVGDFCVCTDGSGEQIALAQHRTRNRT